MKLHVHGHWFRTMPPVIARQLYRSNLNWHTCVHLLTTLVRNVSLSRVFFELLACFSHVSSKLFSDSCLTLKVETNIDIVSEFVIYGCMSACLHDLVSKMRKTPPPSTSRPFDATKQPKSNNNKYFLKTSFLIMHLYLCLPFSLYVFINRLNEWVTVTQCWYILYPKENQTEKVIIIHSSKRYLR